MCVVLPVYVSVYLCMRVVYVCGGTCVCVYVSVYLCMRVGYVCGITCVLYYDI